MELPLVPFVGLKYETFGTIESIRWARSRFFCQLTRKDYSGADRLRQVMPSFADKGWQEIAKLSFGIDWQV